MQHRLTVFDGNAAAHLHFNACIVPRRHRMSFPAHSTRARLLAWLALAALASPASAADPKPLTTILLVAQPELRDPNFGDSVVLVMNNLAVGPKGIIVNRPTRVTVAQVFPDVQQLARIDDKVYFGGPVDIGSVTILIRAESAPQNAVAVLRRRLPQHGR
jgi:hypothetical protein